MMALGSGSTNGGDMKHKCKICGKLDTYMTMYGKHGWYHPSCVFEAWQAAVKELEWYRNKISQGNNKYIFNRESSN